MFIKYFKNCIEAMPKGGDLYFTLVPDHKHIQLYIKDTGVGMDSEQVKRLGSPFYSTKEKGTGLGMMVVFSVVRYEWKIDIISEKESVQPFINFSTHKNVMKYSSRFSVPSTNSAKAFIFRAVVDFLYVLPARSSSRFF